MKRILIIRMMGLGDVASILIPAAKIMRRRHPEAEISVVTYGSGCELMEQVSVVDRMFTIFPEQWPNDIFPAMESFVNIAGMLVSRGRYDQIVNLDTWFMPCFLAQVLKDSGQPVVGNYLHYSGSELLAGLESGEITPAYVASPSQYMKSDLPRMQDWFTHWWDKCPEDGPYPMFYLNHCCGFDEEVEISLDVPVDEEFLTEAQGRKIVATSFSGRVAAKNYPHKEKLAKLLKTAGYYLWDRFDGSLPMKTTLERLRVTDLLVTVPTSTQWLAHLVGCPSLVIPGPLNPAVLSPKINLPKTIECQHCFTSHTCPKALNFACMNIPPEKVAGMVRRYFEA